MFDVIFSFVKIIENRLEVLLVVTDFVEGFVGGRDGLIHLLLKKTSNFGDWPRLDEVLVLFEFHLLLVDMLDVVLEALIVRRECALHHPVPNVLVFVFTVHEDKVVVEPEVRHFVRDVIWI